jgi:small subunit ribosomal protein S6
LKTLTKKLYEAMFLIDSAQAGSDWDGTMAAVKRVLERADAEVVYLEKWADRRLAFEIDHKTRGTYILCYFRTGGSKIAGIEKDVNLSEQILRVLILTAEDRPGDSVKRDLAGETKAPQESYGRDDDRSERRRAEAARDKASDKKDEKSAEPTDAEATVADAAPKAEASVEAAGATETPAAQEPETTAEQAPAADEAKPDSEPDKG